MFGSAHTSSFSLKPAVSALAVATALSLPVPAFADTFQNSGFETGDTTGWVLTGGKWYSGNWPPLESEYSGPANLVQVQTAGNFDAITGAPTVFEGNYALKLNDSYGGNDITALSQSVSNYTGNKLYYAWNAVLEPSHGATDSPSFIIKVVDETDNKVVTNVAYSAYSAQNTSLFRSVNGFVTTDWKVEDIDMVAGHDYKMVFVAVDCLWGGHAGYVYVDGFGDAIPVANADVPFDPATGVVRGADILIPIGGSIPDIDLAKAYYTTSELAADQVNPVFEGGTLLADTANDVTDTLTVNAAGGTIDTNGFDVTFRGGFGGVGGLTKIGAGTMVLSDYASTIYGSFAVNAGTLQLSDALSALSIDVNEGATLSGSGGAIADVYINDGATLAPGAALGTLSVVAGDVVLADGATFALDIDGTAYSAEGGPGTYDRLALLADSTFLANGTIAPNLRDIVGGNNTFVPAVGNTFLVVTGGPNSGAFDAVAQPASGMAANTRFDVIYRPNDIYLAVTPGNFASWGASHGWKLDAISAAAGIDPYRPAAGARSGVLYPLMDGIYGMDSDEMGYAFQQVSGGLHADTMQLAQNAVRTVTGYALDGALDPWGCSPAPQTPGSFQLAPTAKLDEGCGAVSTSKGGTVWGSFIGSRTKADEDAVAYGYRQRTQGLIAGASILNRDGLRAGIGASYSDGDFSDRIGGSADLDNLSVFAYGAARFGGLSVGATVGYSVADVETVRQVGLTTGVQTALGKYKVKTVSGALEARYDVKLADRTMLLPVAGVEFAKSSADADVETGSATVALALPKENWTSARTKLGAEVAVGVGNPVEFSAHGNWHHELGDTSAVRTAILGPAAWRTASVIADKDTFEAGGRLQIKASNNVKVRFEYTAERGGSYSSDRGMAGVAVLF